MTTTRSSTNSVTTTAMLLCHRMLQRPKSAIQTQHRWDIFSYVVATATSFSPLGPFYKLRTSPGGLLEMAPLFHSCDTFSSETYIAQVSLGRILVAKLVSNASEDGTSSPTVETMLRYASVPALVSRPGSWDAHIRETVCDRRACLLRHRTLLSWHTLEPLPEMQRQP